MKYLKIGGTWILTILLAVLMVGPGSQKFMGPTWERMFRAWGYPDGFYLVIGAVEVVARVSGSGDAALEHIAALHAVIQFGH